MTQANKQQIQKQLDQASRYLEKAQIDDAQTILAELSKEDISDLGHLIQLGSLALNLGNIIYAINIFSKAVEVDPDNATNLDLLAYAMIQNGMDLKAVRCGFFFTSFRHESLSKPRNSM